MFTSVECRYTNHQLLQQNGLIDTNTKLSSNLTDESKGEPQISSKIPRSVKALGYVELDYVSRAQTKIEKPIGASGYSKCCFKLRVLHG